MNEKNKEGVQENGSNPDVEVSEENKHKLLEMSEISLLIDTYDDIFSDFDPRPYSQRSLSDDFLFEAKKASRKTPSDWMELKFLIPENIRNKSHENIIKRRLKEHFSKHFTLLKKEAKNMINEGLFFVALGIVLMLIATSIMFNQYEKNFFMSFLVVLMEPAGWFLFWEGLRLIIFESKTSKPDLEFYEKMSECEISFWSY